MSEFEEGALGDGPRLPAHLYVHVPFCASKCDYCDFESVAGASDELVSAVFAGVRNQASQWVASGLDGVIETVYVGGGTPSLFAEQVARTLARIMRTFVVHAGAEITVEGNPDSLGGETVRVLSDAGATRVSVGVQSFDDGVLRVLGRRHDAHRAEVACEAVVEAGLALSVDLMCGIPGQTLTSWMETLRRAVETGAGHVSVYPLSIEDGTPMQVGVSAGLLEEPDPDVAAEMMVLAEEFLGYHGIARYEVANYARRGAESRHNSAYWTGRPYLGIGPAAHGMLDVATARAVGLVAGDVDADVARVRYANAAGLDEWLTLRGDSIETLTAEEAAREDAMLGMRLVRGVSAEHVTAAGLDGALASLVADGLAERVGEGSAARWRTTRRGWLLGNEVFSRIWLAEPGGPRG